MESCDNMGLELVFKCSYEQPHITNEKIQLIYNPFDVPWKRQLTFVQQSRVSTKVRAPKRWNHTKAWVIHVFTSVQECEWWYIARADVKLLGVTRLTYHTYPTPRL